MNRRILTVVLVLISVFVVGKIVANGLQWSRMDSVHTASASKSASLLKQSVGAVDHDQLTGISKHKPAKDKAIAWGDLWLPSAEAAAAMPIAEESATSNQDMQTLQQARAQIAIKEKQLNEHLDALNNADARVKKRIAELKRLESNIQDWLDQESTINNKKIKRLTAVYAGMKPDKAAAVIAQMDLVTVVKIFSKMDEKKVGKILSFLKPKQAMTISEALTKGVATL